MSGISYYPNPFSGRIKITFISEYAEPTTLTVKDVLGKVVKTEAID
jgi:hypothetical protein